MPDPIVIGSTRVPLAVTWKRKDGSIPNLSGATITARFGNTAGVGGFLGTGTVSAVDLPNGKFNYKFASADFTAITATGAGDWYVQFKADYGGPDPEISIAYLLTFAAAV